MFDQNYKGLEDYIVIADGVRSPMGTFVDFYSSGQKQWNNPKEEDISGCQVAAIDPYFEDATDMAAQYCVKHGKQYVTIECKYDSYLHQNSAITVISGEWIQNNYPESTREELLPLYMENSNGLT